VTGRSGTVWYGNRRVGRVQETDRLDLLFAYDPSWLDGSGFPISLSLPLSQGDAWVHGGSFFGGLLPEGAARTRICRRLGIDEADDTGLLLAIGGDCAGALSVFPTGEEAHSAHAAGPAQRLAEEELLTIARSEGREVGRVTGESRRFSLAGAQDKLPVCVDEDRYYLPDRFRPSTHILKFETFPGVCLSEYLANRLAAALGLEVVKTRLMQAEQDATVFLQIERYDRQGSGIDGVRRLHQEDVLQALGEPEILKYQRDGGPGLDRIAALLRRHLAQPAAAIAQLRDWQIFNVLVGNWDGHSKNLALLYAPGSAVPRLAPFYDLVSIEFLNQAGKQAFSRDLALAVGQAFIPERVGREQWEAFAAMLQIPARPLLKRVKTRAEQLLVILPEARNRYAAEFGDSGVLDVFEKVIRKRCRAVEMEV